MTNLALKTTPKPQLGFGLGLRTEYYQDILHSKPPIDWFEIITENYLVPGGKPHFYLEQFCEQYPIVMHGVSLSIGSTDPLDFNYLRQVKCLAEKVKPRWLSDHLCWTGVLGKNMHDLLPLPYTDEALAHVVNRINQVQDFLGEQILIENVSSYITYQQSHMSEWEFLKNICEEANCLILLDINNVYVSAINHEFNPIDYLAGIPHERVYQIHLAGHSDQNDYKIDTHDHPIIPAVWDLYRYYIKNYGLVSTMIERDDHIPPLSELLLELNHARNLSNLVGEKKCG